MLNCECRLGSLFSCLWTAKQTGLKFVWNNTGFLGLILASWFLKDYVMMWYERDDERNPQCQIFSLSSQRIGGCIYDDNGWWHSWEILMEAFWSEVRNVIYQLLVIWSSVAGSHMSTQKLSIAPIVCRWNVDVLLVRGRDVNVVKFEIRGDVSPFPSCSGTTLVLIPFWKGGGKRALLNGWEIGWIDVLWIVLIFELNFSILWPISVPATILAQA